jgi:hypothetical protein
MTLTTTERHLAALYFLGDNLSTAAVIREALPDIHCPHTISIARSAIHKLEAMDRAAFIAQLEEELYCA